jgi:hypothetical protein
VVVYGTTRRLALKARSDYRIIVSEIALAR